MVFCMITIQNLKNIKLLLSLYRDASGQYISLDKCRFYFGYLSNDKIAGICQFLGFGGSSLPFTYLVLASSNYRKIKV